jgi:hypothetical protein
LEQDGFVVVPGLLNQEVPDLLRVYRRMLEAIAPADPYYACGMTGTNYLGDRALRYGINHDLDRLVAPALPRLLDDGYRFVGASLRVKQTGPESYLCLHQDPSMVDEARHWSMNIIVPLVDTTAENGAIQVIVGSHHFMPKIRSLDLEDRLESMSIQEEITDHIETIPMRAGDAIFYFNSLLHGSGVNVTQEHRPVVLGCILSAESPMILYLRNPEQPTIVERFEVPDDYFASFEHFDRDFKARPKDCRRLEDIREDAMLPRDQIIAAIRARATRR